MTTQYSAVVGAGTMGLGITYVLAAAGDTAILVEPDAGRGEAAIGTLTGVAESAVKRGNLDETAAKELIDRLSVVPSVETSRRKARSSSSRPSPSGWSSSWPCCRRSRSTARLRFSPPPPAASRSTSSPPR